ncbi:Clr5 domain-containing protein [Truncatella angustata]|uniref:Clr5 domain-containing protein n=1 Tax=Truncatella angustata TaxID=152316 RepID=A0A9P8UTI2_9PEZI|nr:Clr5 domain-containing protein [Truncatella angustata]KAH6657901.1 Clr5 domain-containing protein [Truncatella angustata]
MPTSSLTQEQWANVRDWNLHKEIIRELYWEDDKPLREVMQMMEKNYNFHATAKMYKYRIRQWGFRKNLTTRDSLAIRRQADMGKPLLPTIHGRQLGSARLKALVSRVNEQGPRSLSSPDSIRIPEMLLYEVLAYSNGAFDSELWELGTFNVPGYSSDKVVTWGRDLQAIANEISQQQSRAPSPPKSSNFNNQFLGIARRQEPLLVPSIYLGFLSLASFVGDDVALSFAVSVTEASELQFGRSHPLSKMLRSVRLMGIEKARQAADIIVTAQLNVFQERAGSGNPLIRVTRVMMILILNKLELVSTSRCLDELGTILQEFENSPRMNAESSGYHTNLTRCVYAAYLSHAQQHDKALAVLKQINEWLLKGELMGSDKPWVDFLNIPADIDEPSGKDEPTEVYLQRQLAAAARQCQASQISWVRYSLAHERLARFYSEQNRMDTVKALYQTKVGLLAAQYDICCSYISGNPIIHSSNVFGEFQSLVFSSRNVSGGIGG